MNCFVVFYGCLKYEVELCLFPAVIFNSVETFHLPIRNTMEWRCIFNLNFELI